MSDPVAEFRAAIKPDGPGPVYYLFAALLALDDLGWLTSPLTHHDDTTRAPQQPGLRATLDALYGADGQYLSGTPFDPDLAGPHVVLWCLRLNGYLHPVAGLDLQLHDWRAEAEAAAGEPFHWIPSFPEYAS